MKKILFMGAVGAGKTSLCQVLSGQKLSYKKTQAPEYGDWMIDIPGEYIENRRFQHAILSLSPDADIIALVQDATAELNLFYPGFAGMFNQLHIGIITKVDHPDADVDRAHRYLRQAGVEGTIIESSAVTGKGLDELRSFVFEEEEENENDEG